jgi:uncharacterized protein
MNPLIEFKLPLQGLKSGLHEFKFKVGKSFFEHFENELISDGAFDISLQMERRPDLMVLDFSLEGFMKTPCDRCLEEIKLPMEGQNRQMVKFTDELQDEDSEVIFMPENTPEFDVSHLVYEFILLSVPLIKVYDCEQDENAPCNPEMLKKLGMLRDNKTSEEKAEENPIWDVRKKIKKN